MRIFFNGLIAGVVLGAAGFWFVQKKANQHPEAQQHYESAAAQTGVSVGDAAQHLSEAMKAKLETLELGTDQIESELAHTGKVVRRKARDLGEQVVDEAADVRIVTAIKAKFAADSQLSVWNISVSSDHGHVILSGSVSNRDSIGKAVALALETDGVIDVTFTLNVKPNLGNATVPFEIMRVACRRNPGQFCKLQFGGGTPCQMQCAPLLQWFLKSVSASLITCQRNDASMAQVSLV